MQRLAAGRPAFPVFLTVVAVAATLASCRTLPLGPSQQPQQAGVSVVDGAPKEKPTELPNHEGSLKFLAFGDFGTGEPVQYDLAAQMAKLHERFKFELVILLGDNLYGSERPQDFAMKF